MTIENLSNASDEVNVPKATSTAGVQRNNPGNLRFIDPAKAFNGQIGNDRGFGVYETLALGTRALYQQLLAYKRRGTATVRKIISTYAPSSENPTEAYIKFVAGRLNVTADETIDVVNYRVPITAAIIRFEQGRDAITTEDINKWTLL